MLKNTRAALEAGDPERLLGALQEVIAAGASPRQLIEVGLDRVLQHPLRGSRWTDAFLALAASSFLSDRLGDAVGLPAAVSALHFLAGSAPGPAVIPPSERVPQGRSAWFRLGTSAGVGGWGRHAMVARSGWTLTKRFGGRAPALATACAAHWSPPVRDRAYAVALSRAEAAGLGELFGEVGGKRVSRVREGRAVEVLEGTAETTFVAAMRSGEPPIELAAAVCVAAARVCSVMPGPRQVHGLLLARALFEAMRPPGLDVRGPVLAGARFVGEGWAIALRSGRVPTPLREEARGLLAPAAEESLEGFARRAAPLELTLSWGHPLRLVEAALALREQLPPSEEAWLTAAVAASARTWPRSQRPWRNAGDRHV